MTDISNLRIVLSGAQGTGKTSLAKVISEKYGNEFKALKTTSLMPDGINSHLDVLKMAVIEPQMGVKFQQDLIVGRSKLFRESEGPFVSDRAVIDSYVYYILHNSPFSNEELSLQLEDITMRSFEDLDVIVMFDLQNQNIEDNSVRVISSGYHRAFTHSVNGIAVDLFGKLGKTVKVKTFYENHEEKVSNTCYYLPEKSKILMILTEPEGFTSPETRLKVINKAISDAGKFKD